MFNRRYSYGAIPVYRLLALIFAILLAPTVAVAGSVYKCTKSDGAIAFQAQPCALAEQQDTVTLEQAPAYAPPPSYAVGTGSARKQQKRRKTRQFSPRVSSYECRSSDGQVFYRHHGCPHAVASRANPAKSASVSALKVSRQRACAQIHRAGAIGRIGHAHDENVSTYDHDLGRDPCA